MSLIGKDVVVFAANYIYSGRLLRESHDRITLLDPSIVYETGPFDGKDWKDAQRLPVDELLIERSAVESLGEIVRRKTG